MSSTPSRPRFTDQQVAAILRRAAELQDAGPAPRPEAGASGDEIVQIGSELGIDADHIRTAIREAQTGGTGGSSFFGGPTRIEVEGMTSTFMGDEAWQTLAQECRRVFGRIGVVTEVGGVREWTGGQNDLDEIHVSATKRPGGAVVRATSDMTGVGILLGLVLIVLTFMTMIGILGALGGSTALRIALGVVITGLGGFLFRWWYSRLCQRRQTAIRDLFTHLDSDGLAGAPTGLPSHEDQAESKHIEVGRADE